MSTQTPPEAPVLITVSEAALLLGVAPKTVRRYAHTGVLPACRFGINGYMRISLADVQRLLQPPEAA